MQMRKKKWVGELNKEDLHNHQGFSYKSLINCVNLWNKSKRPICL